MKKAASSSVADQIESASGSFEVCLKYVPYDAKEEEMKEFFSECGELTSIHRMLFPDSGKFRGQHEEDSEAPIGAPSTTTKQSARLYQTLF